MGMFDRIGTLLKSNINAMISSAEDPEKMLNEIVVEMKEHLNECKLQVVATIADEKRLKMQLDAEVAHAAEWEKKAMLAVQHGDDALAREALSRKTTHDANVAGFQAEWEKQHAAAEKLKSALQALTDKIEDASRKKNLLIARAKTGEAMKNIQKTLGSMGEDGSMDAFDRMSEKIDKNEAEASAMEELSDETSGKSLENKFAALEAGAGADDALAALKSKMGVLPAPSSAGQLPANASEPVKDRVPGK